MKPVHRNESDNHCKCKPSDTRLSILVNVKYYCLGCITTTTSKHPAQSLACRQYMHAHTRMCACTHTHTHMYYKHTLFTLRLSFSLSFSLTNTHIRTHAGACAHTHILSHWAVMCIFVCLFSLLEPVKQNNINSLYV